MRCGRTADRRAAFGYEVVYPAVGVEGLGVEL